MKNFLNIIVLISLFFAISTTAQNFLQWGNLKNGKYEVGYNDTVIYKQNEIFQFFEYKESKPFFVSIWYPAANDTNKEQLKYKDYLNSTRQNRIIRIQDSLESLMRKVIIEDGICIDLNFSETNFDSLHKKLFDKVLNTPVRAKRNLRVIEGKFPCIFYHHGSQSTPFDNNVLCEYFASHGFAVVSACYNWPDEKNRGQFTRGTDTTFSMVSNMDFVVEFLKFIPFVDSSTIFAIGHSAGAQIEMIYDNSFLKKPFKKIFSLHTTLENVDVESAKRWSNLNYLLDNKCTLSNTPTELLAPVSKAEVTDKNDSTGVETVYSIELYPKFEPFRFNTTTPYSFVTVKSNVLHDGFISLGNLRLPYVDTYRLLDGTAIKNQQFYYENIVQYIHQKISISSNTTPQYLENNIEKYFKIETKN